MGKLVGGCRAGLTPRAMSRSPLKRAELLTGRGS